METWLLLTAYRKSPAPYRMVPSPTFYDLPFTHNTARLAYHSALWPVKVIVINNNLGPILWLGSLIECLHDPANVQQTSRKCNAGRLLEVCWIVRTPYNGNVPFIHSFIHSFYSLKKADKRSL